MQRRAIIVAGAAGPGPSPIVESVLLRAGFAPAVEVPTVAQALERLRDERVDLLMLPLQGPAAADLSALEREIARAPQTFVLGTGAAVEPDLILRAMRAGVHEFLVTPPSTDDLTRAVDRMVRRARPESAPRLAVVVYSAKGGMGTTSVSLNLAFAFARTAGAGRVALADYVVSGGDVGTMLNLRPSYDIGDLAPKLAQLDAALLESFITRTPQGVAVLAASERPEALDTVDGLAAGRILEELRTHFATTVVDCEHHPTDRTLTALDAADRIVLVTQLSVAAVRSAQRTLQLFVRLGYPDEKIAVVANRTQPGDLISANDVGKVLDRELFFRLPNDYRASEAALTRGLPVVVHDPNTALARAYVALAAKLAGAEGALVAPAARDVLPSRFGRLLGIGRR
ncbi:MAG: AAA family ATPase [Gemmatirosa sp.]